MNLEDRINLVEALLDEIDDKSALMREELRIMRHLARRRLNEIPMSNM